MLRSIIYFALSFHLTLGLCAQQPPSAPSSAQKANQQTLLNDTLNFARNHQEFKDLYFQQHEEEFVRLIKEGQNPKILIIGCSDSRVIPELILNARPGDIFVIRTAGNFVPPFLPQSVDGVAATIQFAVEVLNIPHIIVCGHSHCGAVRGLFQDLDPKLALLLRWLKLGEEAKRLTLQIAKPSTPQEDLYTTAEELNVLVQLEHVMTFPFVKRGVEEGKIALHGWYFNIQTGDLLYYNIEKNRFIPLSKSLIYSSSN
jgi:carbonic anhydrase